MKEQHHCHQQEALRLGRNLKIVGLSFILIYALSFLPQLASLNASLIEYTRQMWWAVALGLFLGGLIDYFVPDGFIFRYLGRRGISSLFYAVIGGFLMAACSHGILAIAMQLYKKGASISSVVTFLLASPWANLPITILLFGFFGLKALAIIGGAMLIALITGVVFMVLERTGMIEASLSQKEITSYSWSKLREMDLKSAAYGVTKGTMNLANMTLWWILIGFLIAAVIQAYVPSEYFIRFLGDELLGLALTLGIATIIEVCSEGSAPLAFELFNQLGTLGHPFVFLMAGVVTDYTEIGLIWTNIGKKAALWLPVVSVPQVLLLGWLFNLLL